MSALSNTPIFCINLTKRTDRWLNVQKQFIKNNLDVIRWNAIDAEEYGVDPLIAASFSHILLLKYCELQKYNSVLIFEDDIILSTNFIIRLEEYLSELPKNFECFSLHCYKSQFEKISEHTCKLLSVMFGAHGIFLKKRAILNILNNTNLYCPEDLYFRSIENIYAPIPSDTLAFQNGTDTDIPSTSVLNEYLSFYEQYKH
jgi:GR25 family glycosyltransferase involved in LPS biosynthesis